MRRSDLIGDAEYARHLQRCLLRCQHPERPQTREQWRMALKYYPTLGQLWEVPDEPDEPEPFDEEWQERFLATLRDDSRFRRAVKLLLDGF